MSVFKRELHNPNGLYFDREVLSKFRRKELKAQGINTSLEMRIYYTKKDYVLSGIFSKDKKKFGSNVVGKHIVPDMLRQPNSKEGKALIGKQIRRVVLKECYTKPEVEIAPGTLVAMA